jgi:hypothetical protein
MAMIRAREAVHFVPITIMVCILLFWVGSLARVNILTWIHSDDFPIPSDIILIVGSDLENTRVLNHNIHRARVYYFDRGSGHTVIFSNHNSEWAGEWERTVWTRFGNANGFVWPYWHHSAEGQVIGLLYGLGFLASILFLIRGIRSKRMRDK